MASEDRTRSRDLIEALGATPSEFDFFQATRRLECSQPEKPRIGRSARASDDIVRFGQEASMAFAPSTIANFEPASGKRPAHMSVNFLGLLGPSGPMPLHITEYVHDRAHTHHDQTLVRFMDIFNDRMIALFYRAWASSRPHVSRDRPDDDRFGEYIASLMGLGLPALRNRDRVPDEAKLHFVGRFIGPRNANGLRATLGAFFGVPVRIQQFIGKWVQLPESDRLRLGERTGGRLGESTIVGSRFWDRQQKFRVVLGPLGRQEFERFLPGGPSAGRLADWVRNWAGIHLDWELQLILRAADVPPTRLGSGCRLGWTTWVTSRTPKRDADQLHIHSSFLDRKGN